MKKNITWLVLTVLVVLGISYGVFHFIPKPDLTNRGAPDICITPPVFSDYSVPVEQITPVPWVDLHTNDIAREIEDDLLAATVSAKINFAGRYYVVEHDCGLNCQTHAIVGLGDGDIYYYGLESSLGLDYRLDSRLIVVNPAQVLIPTGSKRNVTRFYEFKENKLHYICEGGEY